MEQTKVDLYITSNAKYLPANQLPSIKALMEKADDSKALIMQSVNLKDPVMVLVISLLFGGLGIDRFLIGDVGMGILKLLTGGGCGIVAIYDWFTIMNRTREKNAESVLAAL